VRIISRRLLREFWESRKQNAETAERDLTAWHTVAKREKWANFTDLKRTFGSADRVGNCVAFDIGNNRYRLIARINHRKGIVYTLRVMDHFEYDKKRWVDDCGCHKPAPKKKG
jgi:mRNA interferase HigB